MPVTVKMKNDVMCYCYNSVIHLLLPFILQHK